MEMDYENIEASFRSKLSAAGYVLRKTRGGYMIIDADKPKVVRGSRFPLNLEDVREFMQDNGIFANF